MNTTPKRKPKPTLKELLLTDVGRGELVIPPRGKRRRRKPKRKC